MKDERTAYVYIMASTSGTLYIGSTVDLDRRVYEHQDKMYPKSFTSRYHCYKLVYFEELADMADARYREYQMKKWRREKKEALIRLQNPGWVDLSKKRLREIF